MEEEEVCECEWKRKGSVRRRLQNILHLCTYTTRADPIITSGYKKLKHEKKYSQVQSRFSERNGIELKTIDEMQDAKREGERRVKEVSDSGRINRRCFVKVVTKRD